MATGVVMSSSFLREVIGRRLVGLGFTRNACDANGGVFVHLVFNPRGKFIKRLFDVLSGLRAGLVIR